MFSLPLFFHQMISQRNIWQQLTEGLLPPVVVAVPGPSVAGAAGNATCHRGATVPCRRVTLGQQERGPGNAVPNLENGELGRGETSATSFV